VVGFLVSASVIAPYWEPTTGLKEMLFWRTFFEDGHCPGPGLIAAPYSEFLIISGALIISYVKPIKNNFPLSPELGLNPRFTNMVSSLYAEMRKSNNSTLKRNLKANERLHKV
jgi:hypothetical protein